MGKYDVTILMVTLGQRHFYLKNTINRLYDAILSTRRSLRFKCVIVVDNDDTQVVNMVKNYTDILDGVDVVFVNHKTIGIGESINRALESISEEDLVLKLDDDCTIINYYDFFRNAKLINQIYPHLVFSPFPVGLINNLGGPPKNSQNRRVIHHKFTNSVFTLRPTNHVGGFSRFSPAKFLKDCKFNIDLVAGISGTEDGQFSEYCLKNKIEMAYLENGLIVEHADSTLGQIVRCPDYFKTRSSESAMVFDIIEC